MLKECYLKIKNNELDPMDMKNTLLNPELIFNLQNYEDYCNILSLLKERNNKVYLLEFYNLINKFPDKKPTFLTYYILCEQSEFTKVDFKWIIMFIKNIYFSNNVKKILLKEIESFLDKEQLAVIKRQYSAYIDECLSDEQHIDINFLNSIDFSWILPYVLPNLVKYMGISKTFDGNLIKTLKSYPNQDVTIWYYEREFLNKFSGVLSQVHFGIFSLEEIKEYDKIISEKYNDTNGFLFLGHNLRRLLEYYKKQNDTTNYNKIFNYYYDNPERFDFKTTDIKEYEIDERFEDAHARETIENYIKSGRKDIKLVLCQTFAYKSRDYLLKIKDQSNIYIKYYNDIDGGITSLKEFQKAVEFYDATADYIKQLNLSPLEQYILAYFFTKIYKPYKFYQDSEKIDREYPAFSRHPILIIGTDWIVCKGYTAFLNEILSRLNIKNGEILTRERAHAEILVNINDPKYNINGVYQGDPTADSHEFNSYRSMLKRQTKESFENLPYYDQLFFSECYQIITGSKNKTIDFQHTNQSINPNVLKEAFKVVLEKTKYNLSENDIENELVQISAKSDIDFQFKRTRDLMNKLFKEVFDKDPRIIDAYIGGWKYGTIKWSNVCDYGKYFALGFNIVCDLIDDENLKKILDEISLPGIDSEVLLHRNCCLEIKIPSHYTVGQVLEVVDEYLLNLNQLIEKPYVSNAALGSTKK